jgi:DNA gyrase subunit A
MIAMQASNRNGPLVGVVQLFDRDEIMLISDQGTMVRTRCDEISVLGRNTQGVRVIRLRDQEIMVGLARVEEQNYVDDFESED